jgi:hypothetical protein
MIAALLILVSALITIGVVRAARKRAHFVPPDPEFPALCRPIPSPPTPQSREASLAAIRKAWYEDPDDCARVHQIERDAFGAIVGIKSVPIDFPRAVTVPLGCPFDEALPPLSGREEARRSFAYGNLAIDRPDVTRLDIDRAADAMTPEAKR